MDSESVLINVAAADEALAAQVGRNDGSPPSSLLPAEIAALGAVDWELLTVGARNKLMCEVAAIRRYGPACGLSSLNLDEYVPYWEELNTRMVQEGMLQLDRWSVDDVSLSSPPLTLQTRPSINT
jgi:hypothetical protein